MTVAVLAVAGVCALTEPFATAGPTRANLLVSDNAAGQVRTFSSAGAIDDANPFFQDLGTNGRRCVTCHQPAEGWSITPAGVQRRFAVSQGDEAIFRTNDGANCEGALPRTVAEKRAAYSLLLTRGVIRVALDVPAGAEFLIDSVADPNGCTPSTNDASLFRRPLPSTNVKFLSTVMWDGRASSPASTLVEALARQANDATRGHAAAARDLTPDEARQIVAFEMGLFTAQARDAAAGTLTSHGATGGPIHVSRQPFFIGINDPVGLNPAGAPFDPRAFTIFTPWAVPGGEPHDRAAQARLSIARGQEIFNTKPIVLSGVGGLNGETFANGVTLPDAFVGTCTVCHDAPNAGNHSVTAPLDIGLGDPDVAPYLPVYTLRRLRTGETVRTTDPGRAMVTGRWADIGRFKGPVLRALAARPPYFHNGSAATLDEVLDFYERRFAIGFTAHERADLIAFLRAL